MIDIMQLDSEYIANTYARFPIQLTRGKGSLVYDNTGKRFIDLGSGIAVNSFGIADDDWIKAVTAQLCALPHTSNLYYTQPCALLAEKLCLKTGMKKVFFSNSGAEANECAIKAARKYASVIKGEEFFNIITLKNSFHGRTLTTLAATGQDAYHADFKPLTEGFLYCEANNIAQLNQLVSENKVAAIMFEVIQGEGGVIPLEADFLKAIERIALENDILMIADEVQTGNGRSGMMYAYMNYGILPDIVSTAKGLGGGLPIGATLLGEKVKDVFTHGAHGSTFGGNPACCAGAISIVDRLDDELLSGVKEKSAYIFNELSSSKGIRSISGLGLMIGIETEKDAGTVVNECMNRGVLVLKAKNKVRLLPALNIPNNLLCEAIGIIKEVC